MNQDGKVINLKLNNWRNFFRLFKVFVDRQWVFRGHESSEWRLQSSLERDYAMFELASSQNLGERGRPFFVGPSVIDEKLAIENFRRMAAGRLSSTSSLVETLAVMQHYGAKTRLLDFTYSPVVALHFAYETRATNKERTVWAVNLGRLIRRSDALKDALGRFGKTLVVGEIHAKRCVWMQDVANELAPAIVPLADRCIESEDHGNGILPIQLPGNNERLVAQNGLFLFPKNFKSFETNLSAAFGIEEHKLSGIAENPCANFQTAELRDFDIIKIDFGAEMESRARALLDLMNISPQNLFPGIEGMARNVRYAYGRVADEK